MLTDLRLCLVLAFSVAALTAHAYRNNYNDSPIDCDPKIKWNGKPGGCQLCIGKSGESRSRYICSAPFSPREQNRLQKFLILARSYNTSYPKPPSGFDASEYVKHFQPVLCADSYVELDQLRYRMELIQANQKELFCKRPKRGPASIRSEAERLIQDD